MRRIFSNTKMLYLIGYVVSLALTINAFVLIVEAAGINGEGMTIDLVIKLTVLAILQLITQLIFFLHLGREQKPRWNSMAFWTMLSVVLFIVVGSIWIMYHLDYNMMPQHIDEYIMEEERIYR